MASNPFDKTEQLTEELKTAHHVLWEVLCCEDSKLCDECIRLVKEELEFESK